MKLDRRTWRLPIGLTIMVIAMLVSWLGGMFTYFALTFVFGFFVGLIVRSLD